MNAEGRLVRVGEVAERLGVSPRTVKYYEELGLVEPGERSAGGFRLYGSREIERLERILRMKSIGYSLAAIRELLAVRDRAQEADRVTVLRSANGRLRSTYSRSARISSARSRYARNWSTTSRCASGACASSVAEGGRPEHPPKSPPVTVAVTISRRPSAITRSKESSGWFEHSEDYAR